MKLFLNKLYDKILCKYSLNIPWSVNDINFINRCNIRKNIDGLKIHLINKIHKA